MKKFCAILFSFVLVLMLALPVAAEDAAGESDSLFDTAPALTAPAGYVVNLDTNIVVYEKNSETQLSAASLTKMMTTLLLLGKLPGSARLHQPDRAKLHLRFNLGAKHERLHRRHPPGRDPEPAQPALRHAAAQRQRGRLHRGRLHGGGSIDNFVAMMNDEAKAVGCTGTTFVDPCGLNPNNITTARDAYLILRALTAYDVFATVIATPSYDMGTNDRYTTPAPISSRIPTSS